MKCPKCGGLMFLNRLFTPSGAYWEWGCIACGYHTDKEIEANRREGLERIKQTNRGKGNDSEKRNRIL